jgi:hypothetical protein
MDCQRALRQGRVTALLLLLKVVSQWENKSLSTTNAISALLRPKHMTRPALDHNERARRWRSGALSYEPSGRAELNSAVFRIGDRGQLAKIS